MTTRESRYSILLTLDDWDAFLMENSGLPGPRANLELVQAVADLGDRSRFDRWLTLTPEQAPTNTPEVFLVVCGAVGLGRLVAEGDHSLVPRLRVLANDPRWRVREAVAMALQRWGAADMAGLVAEMEDWAAGSRLEQRAAVAALAEPPLLRNPAHAAPVLGIFDHVTASLSGAADRRTDDFRVLRQALGYAWSVVAVAFPDPGLARMERWMASLDPDIRWVMRENLKKSRLTRLDAAWVEQAKDKMAREPEA
ncbi:MAG: hypothetical protein U0822_06735 [Anaerolineae bacterium]